ncbi:MAG: ester cyclase [Chloroflexi bacterium]|nr:ester cyclase [Chloroflexota bacterium]
MTLTVNKATARSYFERFANFGDMAAADAIFAPDVQFNYPLGGLSGVDAVKRYIQVVRTAFPDVRFTVEDLFGEGERIAARWSMIGTQTGEFGGKPPTGKQVTLPGNTVFHIHDGKIQEIWIAFNPSLLV